jgi:predicted GNAT superfamily acetyltransferase
MVLSTFFHVDAVVLLWRKSLNVAFLGYVENGLYVVDFLRKTRSAAIFLFTKEDVGWLCHHHYPML